MGGNLSILQVLSPRLSFISILAAPDNGSKKLLILNTIGIVTLMLGMFWLRSQVSLTDYRPKEFVNDTVHFPMQKWTGRWGLPFEKT